MRRFKIKRFGHFLSSQVNKHAQTKSSAQTSNRAPNQDPRRNGSRQLDTSKRRLRPTLARMLTLLSLAVLSSLFLNAVISPQFDPTNLLARTPTLAALTPNSQIEIQKTKALIKQIKDEIWQDPKYWQYDREPEMIGRIVRDVAIEDPRFLARQGILYQTLQGELLKAGVGTELINSFEPYLANYNLKAIKITGGSSAMGQHFGRLADPTKSANPLLGVIELSSELFFDGRSINGLFNTTTTGSYFQIHGSLFFKIAPEDVRSYPPTIFHELNHAFSETLRLEGKVSPMDIYIPAQQSATQGGFVFDQPTLGSNPAYQKAFFGDEITSFQKNIFIDSHRLALFQDQINVLRDLMKNGLIPLEYNDRVTALAREAAMLQTELAGNGKLLSEMIVEYDRALTTVENAIRTDSSGSSSIKFRRDDGRLLSTDTPTRLVSPGYMVEVTDSTRGNQPIIFSLKSNVPNAAGTGTADPLNPADRGSLLAAVQEIVDLGRGKATAISADLPTRLRNLNSTDSEKAYQEAKAAFQKSNSPTFSSAGLARPESQVAIAQLEAVELVGATTISGSVGNDSFIVNSGTTASSAVPTKEQSISIDKLFAVTPDKDALTSFKDGLKQSFTDMLGGKNNIEVLRKPVAAGGPMMAIGAVFDGATDIALYNAIKNDVTTSTTTPDITPSAIATRWGVNLGNIAIGAAIVLGVAALTVSGIGLIWGAAVGAAASGWISTGVTIASTAFVAWSAYNGVTNFYRASNLDGKRAVDMAHGRGLGNGVFGNLANTAYGTKSDCAQSPSLCQPVKLSNSNDPGSYQSPAQAYGGSVDLFTRAVRQNEQQKSGQPPSKREVDQLRQDLELHRNRVADLDARLRAEGRPSSQSTGSVKRDNITHQLTAAQETRLSSGTNSSGAPVGSLPSTLSGVPGTVLSPASTSGSRSRMGTSVALPKTPGVVGSSPAISAAESELKRTLDNLNSVRNPTGTKREIPIDYQNTKSLEAEPIYMTCSASTGVCNRDGDPNALINVYPSTSEEKALPLVYQNNRVTWVDGQDYADGSITIRGNSSGKYEFTNTVTGKVFQEAGDWSQSLQNGDIVNYRIVVNPATTTNPSQIFLSRNSKLSQADSTQQLDSVLTDGSYVSPSSLGLDGIGAATTNIANPISGVLQTTSTEIQKVDYFDISRYFQ